MPFKINGTTIIDGNRNYTTEGAIFVTDSIIISDKDDISGEGYSGADDKKVITEEGLSFTDLEVKDNSIFIVSPYQFQGDTSGYTSGGSGTYTHAV
jgi:hypothetical protein